MPPQALPLIRLVERRTRPVRLPAADVAFLVAHARHVIDVVPAFRRGVYRLTPRGYVGCLDGPTRRFAIQPKIPWPNVRMLLGTTAQPGGEAVEPDGGILDVLAREFAALIRGVVRTGLVAGYQDRDNTTAFLRGKLRAAEQLRDAAARAFPDRFHVSESVLDLDTPWNRIPRAIAELLLNHPQLAPVVRSELSDAIGPLGQVSLASVTDDDFNRAAADPRAAHYAPLLALCRTLYDGFRTTGPLDHSAFLVDLSRVFERYLTRGLAAALAAHSSWDVVSHPPYPVGPTVLRPDILVRRRGEPRVVLDAKWKAPGSTPDAADLHQILAYSLVAGATHVGLVYPGRRTSRRELTVAGGDTRVSLIRVQVVGTAEECGRSTARLARFLRRLNR